MPHKRVNNHSFLYLRLTTKILYVKIANNSQIEVNMYNTKQRELILNYLNSHKDKLFCAEDITNALKAQNISQSAIYRNLAELKLEGKLRKTPVSNSRKTFYQFVDCESCKGHLHLSCLNCGKTSHLDDKETAQITQSILSSSNFDVNKDNTVLYGICNKCKEKKNEI